MWGRLFFWFIMTRIVRAYHGTTFSAASAIFHRQSPIRLSSKPGNWLGRGLYFYEENLPQAIDWALTQVRLRAPLGMVDSAAVLVVDLDLTECLDLCSSQWHWHLQIIAQKLAQANMLGDQHGPSLTTARNTTFVVADYQLPSHTSLEHVADREVIDALVQDLINAGESITSVRSSFAIGQQPYSNSHFFSDTHTQIAVIKPDRVVTPVGIIHPVPSPASARRTR